MSSVPPPVPPDQQSDKIVGEHSTPDRKAEVSRDPAGGNAGVNTREQGDGGNRTQNIPHIHKSGDR